MRFVAAAIFFAAAQAFRLWAIDLQWRMVDLVNRQAPGTLPEAGESRGFRLKRGDSVVREYRRLFPDVSLPRRLQRLKVAMTLTEFAALACILSGVRIS